MTNFCGKCRHFTHDDKDAAVTGQCRRRAPLPVSWSMLQSLSIIAGGAMLEAHKTGLLEAAVMDFREGNICNPSGFPCQSAAVWPGVGADDWCGDFEQRGHRNKRGGDSEDGAES